ncbi:MAG: hypothetical protein OEZ58_13955 [Gammaproteobacteria bacterium]|nr:hypothetical protein [Gammaproteobacteria bacterium]MDH5730094.1 hypothetical protein [Gammaproteobacteria bacterium]
MKRNWLGIFAVSLTTAICACTSDENNNFYRIQSSELHQFVLGDENRFAVELSNLGSINSSTTQATAYHSVTQINANSANTLASPVNGFALNYELIPGNPPKPIDLIFQQDEQHNFYLFGYQFSNSNKALWLHKNNQYGRLILSSPLDNSLAINEVITLQYCDASLCQDVGNTSLLITPEGIDTQDTLAGKFETYVFSFEIDLSISDFGLIPESEVPPNINGRFWIYPQVGIVKYIENRTTANLTNTWQMIGVLDSSSIKF